MPVRNPFWDFSLAVWGREAVEPACLELQARHGIDVDALEGVHLNRDGEAHGE